MTLRRFTFIASAYLVMVGIYLLILSVLGQSIYPSFLLGMLFAIPPIAISGPMAIYYSVKTLRLTRKMRRKEKNG